VNYNYEQGKFANILIKYQEQTKSLIIEARKGAFEGMLKNRVFNIIWIDKYKNTGFDVDRKPDRVVPYNGKRISIQHE
jgi:alpha-D-xyloside xylohydrolase